jgi:hypothetical protein
MTWPSPHGAIFRELVHRRLTPSPVLLVSSAAAPLRADR